MGDPLMIFGFSHYGLGKRGSQSEPSQPRDSEAEVVAPAANRGGPLSSAQIYDLAHQRRLRALQSYIEQGYTPLVKPRACSAFLGSPFVDGMTTAVASCRMTPAMR
jgi:hypothetical protein